MFDYASNRSLGKNSLLEKLNGFELSNCRKMWSFNSVSTFSQLLSNTDDNIMHLRQCRKITRMCLRLSVQSSADSFPCDYKSSCKHSPTEEGDIDLEPREGAHVFIWCLGARQLDHSGWQKLTQPFFLIHPPLYLGCVGPSLPEKTSCMQRLWLSTRVNTPLSNHNTCCLKLLVLKTDHIQMSLY